MNEPVRWSCKNCLRDWKEPFCQECGHNLMLYPVYERPRRIEAPEPSRVPGVRSAAELLTIVRVHGINAALMVATTDAVYAALKPAKWSLR